MTKNNDGSEENEVEEIEDWRNEHGDPDFAYLQSLAITGTTEAVDKLKSIAEDLNVDIASDASPDEIIDRIRMTVKKNEDGNPDDTN
ncbi:MAG: hypothetical protein P4L63_03265 [Candidatus Pacebacteria bacterium]|nr:hypothetical protein [Candidatus Paceibacterota bacterium]